MHVKLDLKKLTVIGHSFGGMTAIGAAMIDSRIKACCAMDPWFYTYQDESQTISLKNTPVLCI